MLVTLDEMKTYLGIPLVDTTYDQFLTDQINLISNSIEIFCGRKLDLASYVQTFYIDDFSDLSTVDNLPLFHYPIETITEIKEDDTAIDLSTDVRVHSPTGFIRRLCSNRVFSWFRCVEKVEVTYDAGYSSIPLVIKDVVYSLVGERYNKKVNGIELSFGNDVQRIAIPGVMSLDFDYTLQANERKTSQGMILGNYVNILDPFRSERALVGSIRFNYVS